MKHIPTILLLIFVFACASNCSDNSGIVDPDGSNLEPLEITGDRAGGIDLDALDYETVSGILTPGSSAILMGIAHTWSFRTPCYYALNIPEGALPAGGDPVEFSMSIPTKDSYLNYMGGEDLPLILRMEPDGMVFAEPLTIMVSWMPWRPVPDEDDLEYWFYTEGGGESGHFTDVDLVTIPDGYDQVHFSVDHFSDWGLGPEGLGGKGDEAIPHDPFSQ